MRLESGTKQLTDEEEPRRSPPWTVGLILYAAGVLISIYTGNLDKFLLDYPWACFSVAYMIGAWASPYLAREHRRATQSIRNVFSVSDKKFEEIVKGNMKRLTHPRILLFGLIFLPTLLWAWTQHLWWQEYNSPLFFDLYYLLVLAFMFPAYAGILFGAAVACNLNVYGLCEKVPTDPEYLLAEGQPILRRLWGGLVEKATVIAFIMSALTNVPILLYSGEIGMYLNLALALTLTTLIFLVPHYMFHRLLEKAKDEMLSRILRVRETLGLARLEDLSKVLGDERKTHERINLIYLAQYEWNLRSKSTWLVHLKAVAELLIVASMHVIFMEMLTLLAHL